MRKESEKQPKGLSPKTVRNVHIFISTALGPKKRRCRWQIKAIFGQEEIQRIAKRSKRASRQYF